MTTIGRMTYKYVWPIIVVQTCEWASQGLQCITFGSQDTGWDSFTQSTSSLNTHEHSRRTWRKTGKRKEKKSQKFLTCHIQKSKKLSTLVRRDRILRDGSGRGVWMWMEFARTGHSKRFWQSSQSSRFSVTCWMLWLKLRRLRLMRRMWSSSEQGVFVYQ